MDMTLLGELIRAGGAQTTYGFWMPAGGNDGVAGFEVFLITVANVFTISMQTKSSDQADSAATSIGRGAIPAVTAGTSSTPYQFGVGGARDLVRYVVTSSAAGVVHLQFAQPLWHPN
jgi:hypothetical protein